MFSTGEFSRIARVSKRLLQFYDEEGLFRPAFTDPQTGYRRYQADQLPELNRVLALKELGISLAEIRRVMDRRITVEEVQVMLRARRAELEKTVQEGLQRLRSVELRLTEGGMMPDVVVRRFAAAGYVGRCGKMESREEAWLWMREMAAELARVVPRRCIDVFSVTMPGDGFESQGFNLEAGFVLREGAEEYATEVLEEREMVATVAQTGGPDLSHRGCGEVGRWVERHGYVIVGAPREVFLELPLPVRFADATVESQFTVVAGGTATDPGG